MEENIRQNLSNGQTPRQKPPKTWLVESILATLFCCLPFGIAGIVNASRVETRFYAGDLEGAMEASRKARNWTLWSLGIYTVLAVFGIILAACGVLAGLWGSCALVNGWC